MSFDLSGLTDDALMKKIDDLQKKLNIAYSVSHDQGLINQLTNILQMHRAEISNRNALKIPDTTPDEVVVGEEDTKKIIYELPKRKLWD